MSSQVEQWKKDEDQSNHGWDFSYVAERIIREDPPWSYIEIAAKYARKAKSILDMGTGSGDILSSLAPFSGKVVATESHAPLLPIAKKLLAPFGVKVVDTSKSNRGELPFKDEEFDLVLNRHEFLKAPEIARVLEEGGLLLTQQVSGNDTVELAREFDADPRWPDWNLATAKAKLDEAGFVIEKEIEWTGKITFNDVGAVVYWIKSVPWMVKDFSVEKHFSYLEKLQEKIDKGERLAYKEERFLVLARKA